MGYFHAVYKNGAGSSALIPLFSTSMRRTAYTAPEIWHQSRNHPGHYGVSRYQRWSRQASTMSGFANLVLLAVF
jgi:hypothetical protein